MHRLIAASLAAAGLSVGFGAVASAADLGRPAPVPVYTKAPIMAPPSWTGCYAGIEGGYAFGTESVRDVTSGLTVTNNIKPSGGLAGGTVGCNLQTGLFVFGAENDFSWSGLTGSQFDISPFPTAFSHSVKTTWLDTLRGRVGIAVDRGLFYATGGAAFTNIKDSVDNGFGTTGAITNTVTGWTAGAGMEWMLPDPHWSVKAEYLYADFGTRTDNLSALSPAFLNVSTHLKENIARAGINYRFW
jgi:outer membrane immunogenic protein